MKLNSNFLIGIGIGFVASQLISNTKVTVGRSINGVVNATLYPISSKSGFIVEDEAAGIKLEPDFGTPTVTQGFSNSFIVEDEAIGIRPGGSSGTPVKIITPNRIGMLRRAAL